MKLHLGCGERYFPGYVNIDYPPENQTVIKSKVDEYGDIKTLSYKAGSVEEIRLHHVFEHFDRPTALALLCRWRDFLKVGGLLRIETPDAMAIFRQMTSPWYTYDQKQQIERHLFGSHEAFWAVHWDGWYREKYLHTLKSLGFVDIHFAYNKWGVTRNIEMFAQKSGQHFTLTQYHRAVEKILTHSTVRVKTKNHLVPEGSEIKTLKNWMRLWRQVYTHKGSRGKHV